MQWTLERRSLEHGFEINARREAERTATTERARQQLDRTAVAENSGADEEQEQDSYLIEQQSQKIAELEGISAR